MSHAPTGILSRRHDAIRQRIAEHHLDALVVTALPDILYLENFDGTTAIAVVTADRLIFVTDFRYVTAIETLRSSAYACPDLELVIVDGSYEATLVRTLATLPVARIGFEAAHLTVSRYE